MGDLATDSIKRQTANLLLPFPPQRMGLQSFRGAREAYLLTGLFPRLLSTMRRGALPFLPLVSACAGRIYSGKPPVRPGWQRDLAGQPHEQRLAYGRELESRDCA